MRPRSWLLSSVFCAALPAAHGCVSQPVSAPESEPPAPGIAATPAAVRVAEAPPEAGAEPGPDASVGVAELDASPSDPSAPDAAAVVPAACTVVANPPVYDVHFDLDLRKGKLGSELRARVRVPKTRWAREVWSSPAPTSCESQAQGERMIFHCTTADGEVRGWVGVVGEELVLETRRGEPELAIPIPPPGSNPPPERAKPPFQRESSAKVPCGTKLRVHPGSRSLM